MKEKTLSELINECGYGFRSLTLHTEYNKKREEIGLSKLGRVWQVKAGKSVGGFLTNGFTPEEAVKKLLVKIKLK